MICNHWAPSFAFLSHGLPSSRSVSVSQEPWKLECFALTFPETKTVGLLSVKNMLQIHLCTHHLGSSTTCPAVGGHLTPGWLQLNSQSTAEKPLEPLVTNETTEVQGG